MTAVALPEHGIPALEGLVNGGLWARWVDEGRVFPVPDLRRAIRYLRLKPYLSALPVGTPINVCTAPGVVLDSLSDETREFSLNPDDLVNRRKDACFPTLEDMRGSLGDEAYNQVKNSLTESSSYFRATIWVTIGTTQFTLYSLLARGATGTVRPALRSFGSE